jgi:hypothetical protein
MPQTYCQDTRQLHATLTKLSPSKLIGWQPHGQQETAGCSTHTSKVAACVPRAIQMPW